MVPHRLSLLQLSVLALGLIVGACDRKQQKKSTEPNPRVAPSARPARPAPEPRRAASLSTFDSQALDLSALGADLRGRLAVGGGDKVRAEWVLEVSRKELRLQGKRILPVRAGRVSPKSKGDGPAGYFIDPLHLALKELNRRIRKKDKNKPACLLVAADRELPFRLLAEVLLTAGQSGFTCYQLASQSEPGSDARLVAAPLSMATPASRRASPKTLMKRTDDWGQVYWGH